MTTDDPGHNWQKTAQVACVRTLQVATTVVGIAGFLAGGRLPVFAIANRKGRLGQLDRGEEFVLGATAVTNVTGYTLSAAWGAMHGIMGSPHGVIGGVLGAAACVAVSTVATGGGFIVAALLDDYAKFLKRPPEYKDCDFLDYNVNTGPV